jgi:hypothetical protein
MKTMTVLFFSFLALTAQAQDKVNLDTEKVESWFEKNWIWVAGAVLLIIIIALFSSRGRTTRKVNQRKTTTVIKDPEGNVKSITTTEDTV